MLTQYSNLQHFYRGRVHTLFRARRIADGLPVILKTSNSDKINSTEIAALQSEYRILRMCAGAGVSKALSLIPFGTKIAIVMEDCGNRTLADLLGLRRLDLNSFLRLAVQLTETAKHVHDCGVIHREFNPSNIMVSSDEFSISLIDFGKATTGVQQEHRQVSPSSLDLALTYVSPEQTGRMNRSVDHRSDLYSLGVIFYEMLTGRPPFSSGDPLELVHAHLSRFPPSPKECDPDIPVVLSDIVLRLLAKAPEDRYHSAYGLLQDLLQVQKQLQESGTVRDFETGLHDRPKGLQIPERLYGRTSETAQLLESFNRVAERGLPELVLIGGVSGVGKTALVRELYKPLTKERGLFSSGKFDQHKRDVPFSTIAQAFRETVRYALTEPEERVNQWRSDLREALGLSGGLIAALVPEVELLVGAQPAVPELSAADEQKRFDSVFRKFVEVCARREHPLVIFLDDLQWADAASLRMITNLVCDPGPLHLLLIGAYRDNEVDSAHLLSKLIAELRKSTVPLHEIALPPLSTGHVSALVSDALGCSQDVSAPLVRLVFDKTRGNPFFAVQLLKSLYHEKLLSFNMANGCWEWDLPGVDAVGYSDNVVDLLLDKLRRLPASTREMLVRKACLGNRSDVQSLLTVVDTSPELLEADLSRAVEEGLLVRMDDGVRFLHDRVQQAAYSLLNEQERAATHLSIGRSLLRAFGDVDERIFDIVNQLNHGIALLTDPVELLQLSELNLSAGGKARSSTAYGAAIKFLSTGIDLLPSDCWENNFALAYDLHFERAECNWLLSNHAEAEAQFENLLGRCRSNTEKANIYRMLVELHTSKVELGTAVDCGLKALKLFGINMTPHPTRAEVLKEYEDIWLGLGTRKIEDLVHLPAMTSPEMIIAMDILVSLFAATLCTDQNLFLLAACNMVNISLKHGNCNASAMGYGYLGMGLGPVFGKYQHAYRFGKLGYDLVELHGMSAYRARINFTFGDSINFFQRHLRTDMEYLDVAFNSAVDVGDICFACYSCNHIVANLLTLGDPLDSVYRETERRLEFTRKVNFDASFQAIFAMQRFIKLLRGETNSFSTMSDADFDELSYDALMDSYGQPIVTCWYYILKLQSRVLAGEYVDALAYARKAKPLLWSTMAHIQETEYWFYSGLALTGHFNSLSDSEREHCLEDLETHRDKLEEFAVSCPENFLHKFALFSAEFCRIRGDIAAAELNYQKAIKTAGANGYVNNEGLANELMARFFCERGLECAALGYLEAARSCYERWGATGKVAHLEKRYPQLRSRSYASEPLDVMAVFKAARAISSEVVPERLLETLMRVVVESSGARRGVLVLEEEGELVVRAHGPLYDDATATSGANRIALVEIPVDSYTGAPNTVLNYVARAKDSVLLSNASREGVFVSDPYIRQNCTRSMLCLPITKQDRLMGVLYLENNLASSVFTRERLELMQLLSSQIVTALENGTLFEGLRREVAERKRAEDALRLSEQHLRTALDLVAVGMVQIDLMTHRFLRVNARFCEMLGYTADELLKRTVEEVTDPSCVRADDQTWKQLDDDVVSQVTLKKRYIRKDGKLISARVTAALIRYPDGAPRATIAVIQEIDTRKRKTGDEELKKVFAPGPGSDNSPTN